MRPRMRVRAWEEFLARWHGKQRTETSVPCTGRRHPSGTRRALQVGKKFRIRLALRLDGIEMIDLHQAKEKAKIAADHAASARATAASAATTVASGRRN